MKKNPDLTHQTQANFAQAFWRCCAKMPMKQVTAKAVAQAAGYDRSTFYQYFTNMDELLHSEENALLEQMRGIVQYILKQNASADVLEQALMRAFNTMGFRSAYC